MKILISTVAIAVLAYFAASFGPWWSGVVIALAIAAVSQLKPGAAFVSGFIGLALTWGVSAAVIDAANTGLLSGRIGELLGGLPGFAMVAITAVIGGAIGGLGGLSGAFGMNWLISRK